MNRYLFFIVFMVVGFLGTPNQGKASFNDPLDQWGKGFVKPNAQERHSLSPKTGRPPTTYQSFPSPEDEKRTGILKTSTNEDLVEISLDDERANMERGGVDEEEEWEMDKAGCCCCTVTTDDDPLEQNCYQKWCIKFLNCSRSPWVPVAFVGIPSCTMLLTYVIHSALTKSP